MAQLAFDAAQARHLEATYLTHDLVAQRARVLDLVAPRPGERFLDIGAGPGLLTIDLARLVGPGGQAVAYDLSPDMLALAAARLEGLAQASCVEGDALAIGFPDQAFDAAVSTQVYEYVADMPAALAELRRVLRPGGRALILDSDWRSLVWRSNDEARMERVLKVWDGHLADPWLPSRLGPLLEAAGFEMRRVEAYPMLSPVWQPSSYAAGILQTVHAYVRKNGPGQGLAAEEVAAWRADQDALIAGGGFFFSLNRYLFLATRR